MLTATTNPHDPMKFTLITAPSHDSCFPREMRVSRRKLTLSPALLPEQPAFGFTAGVGADCLKQSAFEYPQTEGMPSASDCLKQSRL